MRASSGGGGGGAGGVDGGDGVGDVGGGRVDAPLPRPLRVLAILYDLTCITPKIVWVSFKDCLMMVLLKLRKRVGRKFSLLVCKQTLLIPGDWLG
jgi:hypothetical protein